MELHKISRRATPLMSAKYKLALLLYKTFNEAIPINEWIALNFNQIKTSRQLSFKYEPSNKYVVGKNVPSNRFSDINGLIPLEWLNKSVVSFKNSVQTKILDICLVCSACIKPTLTTIAQKFEQNIY
jgi:hypothetical protein